MAKVGNQPSYCDDNTHSEAHLSLAPTINESDRKEPMKEEISHENGGHMEAQNKVTYLLLSREDNFTSETIFNRSKH